MLHAVVRLLGAAVPPDLVAVGRAAHLGEAARGHERGGLAVHKAFDTPAGCRERRAVVWLAGAVGLHPERRRRDDVGHGLGARVVARAGRRDGDGARVGRVRVRERVVATLHERLAVEREGHGLLLLVPVVDDAVRPAHHATLDVGRGDPQRAHLVLYRVVGARLFGRERQVVGVGARASVGLRSGDRKAGVRPHDAVHAARSGERGAVEALPGALGHHRNAGLVDAIGAALEASVFALTGDGDLHSSRIHQVAVITQVVVDALEEGHPQRGVGHPDRLLLLPAVVDRVIHLDLDALRVADVGRGYLEVARNVCDLVVRRLAARGHEHALVGAHAERPVVPSRPLHRRGRGEHRARGVPSSKAVAPEVLLAARHVPCIGGLVASVYAARVLRLYGDRALGDAKWLVCVGDVVVA